MESGSFSAAHSNTAHQLRVGSGEHSQRAEETARGSGPAERRQSSWNLARAKPSTPAKSRQVKKTPQKKVSLAFASRAGILCYGSAGQLQAAEQRSPFPTTVHSSSGHDESYQAALIEQPQVLSTTTDLTQPAASNYRSERRDIQFQPIPKANIRGGLESKPPPPVSRFGGTDKSPELDLSLIFVPGQRDLLL